MTEHNKFYSQIKQNFNQAAHNYDLNAVLQHEIGTRLIERLNFFSLQPLNILDLGMGTGLTTKKLALKYPTSNILGLDFAYNMLNIAKSNNLNAYNNFSLICGDINNLPLQSNSIDLIFSNFTMQWGENITKLLQECYRVLKPNGLLLFSIPGPNTLYELKSAFQITDPDYTHINNFIDMHDLGDILVQNRFAHPVMDNEHFTLTYTSVINVIKDLKAIGANSKLFNNYRRTLFGKTKLEQLSHAYQQFKLEDNTYPLTYEVIYGHAFKLKKPVKAKHPEISEISVPIAKIIKK